MNEKEINGRKDDADTTDNINDTEQRDIQTKRFTRGNTLYPKHRDSHGHFMSNNDIRIRIKLLLNKYYKNIPDKEIEDIDPDQKLAYHMGSKYAYKMIIKVI